MSMLHGLTDRRSGRLLAALFGAMVAVLSLLAFLQYRWISEAGDAVERQLRENLAVSSSGFEQDFDDQLRRLGTAFRQSRPAGTTDEQIETQYRQAYDNWSASTSYAGLVEDGFLVRTNSQGNAELLRFDRQNNRVDPVEWPRDLAPLRDLFSRGTPGRLIQQPAAARVPAVIISLFPFRGGPRSMRLPPDSGFDPGPRGRPPFGGERRAPSPSFGRTPFDRPSDFPQEDNAWILLRLNRDFFQNKFLPALIARHFLTGNAPVYDLLISENPTGNVVYRSAPNLTAADFQAADARVFLPEPEAERPPGPPNRQNNAAGGWQLLVRHHLGSVHAAAGQLRQRNVAIGIGILAILAAGLAATWVASERVRALGQMQIELAAGISHELRTPLAVIRSAGYNMLAGHVSSRDDIVRYGHLFQDQGRRLSEVVEQALLFAQTHSGKNSYTLQPADAAEIATKVLDSCKAIDPEAANSVVLKIDSQLPLAMTDATALGHCLYNLIVNAFKYGRNGDIVVEIHTVRQKTNPEIELAVSDTGPGIDRADLPHLFEPFFRGRNANVAPGNGLGLYLVQRTMKSIRGRVAVTSAAGAGTRFALYVPTVPELGTRT